MKPPKLIIRTDVRDNWFSIGERPVPQHMWRYIIRFKPYPREQFPVCWVRRVKHNGFSGQRYLSGRADGAEDDAQYSRCGRVGLQTFQRHYKLIVLNETNRQSSNRYDGVLNGKDQSLWMAIGELAERPGTRPMARNTYTVALRTRPRPVGNNIRRQYCTNNLVVELGGVGAEGRESPAAS